MASSVTRLSKIADATLVMHSEVIHSTFVEHQTHFQQFNAALFKEDFSVGFKEIIDEATAQISDRFIVKEQKQDTEEMNVKADELLSLAKHLRYFVETVFADNAATIERFNLGNISKLRTNIDLFIASMEDMVEILEEFLEPLIAGGYGAEKVAKLKEEVKSLRQLRREQKEMKIRRGELTKQRITKMNNLWKKLTEISDAAEILFEDDPDKQKLFALPQRSENHNNDESLEEDIIAE